jgi:hypothetical protein
MLAVPASAAPTVRTVVTVFQAFTATGKPTLPTKSVAGHCWTGSLAADRADAWRCIAGNAIYDPCFASAAAAGVVLCPNMQVTTDTEIHLTRALPAKQADSGKASVHNFPWLIELAASSGSGRGGVFCEFNTGASAVVSNARMNYYCIGGSYSYDGLWGLPTRKRPEWSIRLTPATAKSLAPHAVANTLAHARYVVIRHVWM